MPAPKRLLILGGTAEAAELAAEAVQRFGAGLAVISSLAGRTGRPAIPQGGVRIGGFGGADGLARYLRQEAIDLVIDATHPFARQISANAAEATAATGSKRLVLARPPWPRHPLDRWIEVGDIAAAAKVLPRVGQRIWLTVGAGELDAFADMPGIWFLVRLVEAPAAPLPLGPHELILGRGPFSLPAERALIRRHQIDALVAKASGGPATYAKIEAAREANLPVVMVRRPPPEPGERVDSIAEAIAWIEQALSAVS
ncbi:MAG: cobalt-precorrin-6A reductase [Proteobacteria bacterium]|nr:cobalt-precorrin-6A reductase [Pseudomonadota bacterium]